MSESTINVQYAQIEQVRMDLERSTRDIRTMLDDLVSQLSVLHDWEGRSKDTYTTAKMKWDAAADQMGMILQRAHVTVGDMSNNYNRTDARLAGGWESLTR
jgi:WXG100 family type VII secretion target